MNENFKESPENFRDYDSALLFKILNKVSIESEKNQYKELFVDQNWKINSRNMNNSNIIHRDNSNLERILSEIFPDKKILIQDNNDRSQTIYLS